MTRDFSNVLEGRRQFVKGRSLRIGSVKIGSDGFLGKSFGVAITGIMLCGFCGSMVMGWMINSGLGEMAEKESVKIELLKKNENLAKEKKELLVLANIEEAAGSIGLYPVKTAQVRNF